LPDGVGPEVVGLVDILVPAGPVEMVVLLEPPVPVVRLVVGAVEEPSLLTTVVGVGITDTSLRNLAQVAV